jgi:GNAT superfamily N-acetyltransferase
VASSDRQIEIRPGTAADIEALARVGSDAFREAYSPHSSAADIDSHIEKNFSVAAVRDSLAAGQSDFYLACIDGDPAGLAKVRLATHPLVADAAAALELQQLYVLADMQRHGLGRCLMGRVFEHARAAAVGGVWLSAWEFADWAVSFYTRVGFETLGKVEFKLGDTLYTDLLMWQPLR